MQRLETATIERLAEPELELLTSLPRLRHLYLEQLRGDLEFEALERCHVVRELRISFPTRAEALQMTARLQLLPELEYVHLVLFDPSPVPIDLAWFPASPNLRDLHLIGSVPSSGS